MGNEVVYKEIELVEFLWKTIKHLDKLMDELTKEKSICGESHDE